MKNRSEQSLLEKTLETFDPNRSPFSKEDRHAHTKEKGYL
jgi:hypothetical protein